MLLLGYLFIYSGQITHKYFEAHWPESTILALILHLVEIYFNTYGKLKMYYFLLQDYIQIGSLEAVNFTP